MAFKFDGTKLTDGSKTFANVKGDKIWEGQVQAKCFKILLQVALPWPTFSGAPSWTSPLPIPSG